MHKGSQKRGGVVLSLPAMTSLAAGFGLLLHIC